MRLLLTPWLSHEGLWDLFLPCTPFPATPCLAITPLSPAKEQMVPVVLFSRPPAARPLPLLPASARTAALALVHAPWARDSLDGMAPGHRC